MVVLQIYEGIGNVEFLMILVGRMQPIKVMEWLLPYQSVLRI